MSEIVNDSKLGNVELTNALGVTLSGTNSRVKHTGTGTMTLSSAGGIAMTTASGEAIALDATLIGESQTALTTGTTTLDVSTSGSTYKIDRSGGVVTINLPTISSSTIGAEYTFVIETSGSSNLVINATADNDMIGNILHDAAGTLNIVSSDGSAKDILTVDDDAVAGSWVKFKAISTTTPTWFIQGMVDGSTAPAFSDS